MANIAPRIGPHDFNPPSGLAVIGIISFFGLRLNDLFLLLTAAAT